MMEKQGYEPQTETHGNFDFTAKEVLNTFKTPAGKNFEFIGTALSSWQQEPVIFGPDGKQLILADWDLNVRNHLTGQGKSTIKGSQNPDEFPRFLPKKELYADRAQEMNQNMFRFSLEFSRLCPSPEEFDQAYMAEYVKALAVLRARGMEPMLAINHWVMPNFLLGKNNKGEVTYGAWENPEIAKHFRFYVENVVKFLADENKVRSALVDAGFDKNSQDKFLSEGLVRYFLSLNEPQGVILPSYIAGIFPPYKKGRVDLVFGTILKRLVEAHDIARDTIKQGHLPSAKGEPMVGVGHNWTYFDGVLGNIAHNIENRGLANRFERGGEYTDFLGLQYYCRLVAGGRDKVYGDDPVQGDIYPAGIYEMLKKMNQTYPNKEIFISEFGFADKTDIRRPYWILETVRYVIEALKNDIPVRGMLLWTLVNNFEWVGGMDIKYGMFDETDLSKTLTPSPKGQIKSWEAWKAVAKAVTNPAPEALRELQDYYLTAKQQLISPPSH